VADDTFRIWGIDQTLPPLIHCTEALGLHVIHTHDSSCFITVSVNNITLLPKSTDCYNRHKQSADRRSHSASHNWVHLRRIPIKTPKLDRQPPNLWRPARTRHADLFAASTGTFKECVMPRNIIYLARLNNIWRGIIDRLAKGIPNSASAQYMLAMAGT